MIERKSGGDPQRRVDRRLPAGPGMAVYFATKAFVLSFSEALHEEVKKHGVIVSARCARARPRPSSARSPGSEASRSVEPRSPPIWPRSVVVRAGLEGLERGRAIVIPGLMNKSTAQAHRFFPRSWVRKAARIAQAIDCAARDAGRRSKSSSLW